MSTLTELRTLLEKRGGTMPVTNAGGVPACVVPVTTLRALVAVAEAADRRQREEQRTILHGGLLPTDEWVYAEQALSFALAPLVKEADDG